jgi:hypothetical protein
VKRRLDGDLEWLWISEWRDGQRHIHVLLRTSRGLPRGVVQKDLAKVGPYRCSCKRVRNVPGVARYIVKDLKNPEKKAEIAPAGFQGRLFSASRGFLTAPLKDLWRQIRQEWQAAGQG